MRTALILVATAAALLVAGCNTIQGVGRDVEAAGSAVAGAAADAKR